MDHEVRIVDSHVDILNASRGPLRGVETVVHFADTEGVRQCMKNANVVFHFAGSMLPNESNQFPARDVSETLAGNLRLLALAAESNVERIVFASSGGTVYGIPRHLPISETHPTDPICSYGIVKLATEKYLALFERLHGIRYVALRLSNPYGEGQYPFRSFGAVASFLGAFAQKRPIEIWGAGNTIRDFLYIDDAVTAILRASAYRGPARVFNIGSSVGTSIRELLQLVRRTTGQETQVIYKPPRAADVPEVVLDIALAQRELAWLPMVTLEEGVLKTWSWCSSTYGCAKDELVNAVSRL
jgi:UDP-glucose 4-epimerase